MKKILIIVYYFPPRGGTAVVRTLKYVKYLREYGWEPVILTVSHNYFAFKDESLLKEIPEGTAIYKTKQPWIQALVRYWQNRFQSKNSPQPKKQKSSSNNKKNKIYLTIKTIKNYINKFAFCPDDYAGWKPLAMRKVKRVLKEHKIDIVYTTSPPHSVQLIGYAVSKKYNIPWIADFRDPWTQDNRYFRPATFLHRHKIEKEENKTVTHAKKIISVSEPMTFFFQHKYNTLNPEKFLTITNGYDSNYEKLSSEKTTNNSKFVITYTGTFYLHQTPVWFYQAVKQFLQKYPEARDKFLIQIVGKFQKDYEAYPHEIGIGDVIKKVDFVHHQEVVKYIINSDVLLLVLYSNPEKYDFVFSGKVFEYLPARKPILATVNQGICADLIKKHDLGIIAPFNDVAKIKNAIINLYKQWQQGQFKYTLMSEKDLRQFHRKNLTERLASVFDDAINFNF